MIGFCASGADGNTIGFLFFIVLRFQLVIELYCTGDPDLFFNRQRLRADGAECRPIISPPARSTVRDNLKRTFYINLFAMNKTIKSESQMKYAELLLISVLTFAVAVGLYFTNIKLW